MAKDGRHRRVPAVAVHQWLKGWDRVSFDKTHHRRKPEPHFFLFSLPAGELQRLSGIFRRDIVGVKPRAADLGIQREHDKERSIEIRRFVESGFPWSTLSEAKRKASEFSDLRKPGWLPTAIVVNILKSDDRRDGGRVAEGDLVEVHKLNGAYEISLPYASGTEDWEPEADSLYPIEVIDGQHRLWAFEGAGHELANFEIPVVAFHGLDISWEAYLFWTINIKPKRINPSLAFDLYPLLRSEDWLERAEGLSVYRETRSQELTEALWAHPASPWYDRINMLGEKRNRWVTQSAWIKSLMASFVRSWINRGKSGTSIGGIFGSRLESDGEVLGWSRAQQAAFLIFSWAQLGDAIEKTRYPWALSLREESPADRQGVVLDKDEDPAFYSPHSLLVTDQGVRGVLLIVNDICYVMATQLDLRSWTSKSQGAASDEVAVTEELKSLKKHPIANTINVLCDRLASFDWRTSAVAALTDSERREKLAYRGGSGYREIRLRLLEHLITPKDRVGQAAQRVLVNAKS